jgi:hypothetical protein
MSSRRRLHRALAAIALLAMVAVAPLAGQQATLGDEGVLYTARVGTYGSFFPNGRTYPATATVLVLEVLTPDGKRTRLLAPSGEKVAPDAVPFVLWEESSRRLFMVWEGLSHIHSAVRLVSFDGTAWSEPVQISGNPFTKKSSPRLAITRESYLHQVDGKAVDGERTLLHIVWYEDDYGDVRVLYAPLALDNGVPPRLLPPIFDLGEFVPEATSGATQPSASLLRSPRVVAAADQKSVLIALADDLTDQLATLRIDVLPVELSAVADALEEFFDDQANDPCSGDVTALAERARAHLVVIGTRFSAYARSYMADAMREWLMAQRNGQCSSGGRAQLAQRARAHLVVIGRRALREVIVAANEERSWLLTFDGAQAGFHNDVSLTVQSAVMAPPALGAGAARIHIGGSGRQTLVSWRGNRDLFYQEHDGTRWLPRQSLALTDSFTVDEAYALLDGKAR